MDSELNSIRSVRWEQMTAVVELEGDIDMHQTPSVHKAIVDICERRPRRLVVDLSAVFYIDSSGVSLFVEVFRRIKAYGGTLGLCGLQERVRGVFEVTRLDKFFSIYDAQSEAIAG
jgi:anti-sigma B factor antagonist